MLVIEVARTHLPAPIQSRHVPPPGVPDFDATDVDVFTGCISRLVRFQRNGQSSYLRFESVLYGLDECQEYRRGL